MNINFLLISEILNQEGFYIDPTVRRNMYYNEPKTFRSISQKYKDKREKQLKNIEDYEQRIKGFQND